ncbi:unnamed protein product [Dicrocoelium dendriticum]|nr:unnamed protein product [Dicrocoelium dendriticum]
MLNGSEASCFYVVTCTSKRGPIWFACLVHMMESTCILYKTLEIRSTKRTAIQDDPPSRTFFTDILSPGRKCRWRVPRWRLKANSIQTLCSLLCSDGFKASRTVLTRLPRNALDGDMF